MLRNINSYLPKEEMIRIAMSYVYGSKVEGDYLEFGVFNGKTLISAFYLAQYFNLKSMKFYAFDSFEGLPELKGNDANSQEYHKGQCYCDINSFKENMHKNGVDLNKLCIVEGWFDKTLNDETKNNIPLKKASIIMVDCNLYESTVPVLNFIADYIQDGTIIIFDDWFRYRGDPEKGEQKAFREWLDKNPPIKAVEYHKYIFFGNSFILSKPKHS